MANMSFSNNAATTLASGITNVASTLTVATSTGTLFPVITGAQYFYCTLANNAGTTEVIKVTARTGTSDTFTTIVRGQDNTSAVAWNTGDKCELRLVAASLNDFPKLDEVNTFALAQTFSTPIVVSSGGTGLATLTANNVILGNGTSNPLFVAPGTSGNVLTSNGSTWASSAAPVSSTIGSVATTTSGTSFDFTGIPATANLVSINLNAVSLAGGTGRIAFQLGSGSIQTTGYTSVLMTGTTTPAIANTSFTTGVYGTSSTASTPRYGAVNFKRVSGNVWIWEGMFYEGTVAYYNFVMGTVTLGGALDRVRLTSSTTDTFNGGTANVTWS